MKHSLEEKQVYEMERVNELRTACCFSPLKGIDTRNGVPDNDIIRDHIMTRWTDRNHYEIEVPTYVWKPLYVYWDYLRANHGTNYLNHKEFIALKAKATHIFADVSAVVWHKYEGMKEERNNEA